MLKTKIISSLEKCFLDDRPEKFAEINNINIYRNTSGCFQFLPYDLDSSDCAYNYYTVKAQGDLSKFVRFRCVENIPNYIPFSATPDISKTLDNGYIRTTPGLYPDVLVPLSVSNRFTVVNQQLRTIWVDVENNGSIPVGEHILKITVSDLNGIVVAENHITINVINASLPEQETIFTQWFYADCIADYYDVKMWSKKHFEICRSFIKTAVKNGINMLLVPVFTPPLDTAVGGERTTTQLVKIEIIDNKYKFDFSLVDKWISMLQECGIKYFEISHLFTQWGAFNAPKIIAKVNGKDKKIFGWETNATSNEYVEFLNRFLEEFTTHLDLLGLREYVYFHLSDEPESWHLEQYKCNKQNLEKVLKGWKILDALSNISFYQSGLCEIPVPISNKIDVFLKEDIKERWIYYCGFPAVGYSNRLLGVPASRTRFLGIQMYKYGINGFLHWGYNFYNNRYSYDHIDPILNGNAGYWGPGGDAVSVYPGRHGQPLESLRLIAFSQGLEDIRVLKLCESYYTKEEIIKNIETAFGESIMFSKCADDTFTMQKIRDTIDKMIIMKLT